MSLRTELSEISEQNIVSVALHDNPEMGESPGSVEFRFKPPPPLSEGADQIGDGFPFDGDDGFKPSDGIVPGREGINHARGSKPVFPSPLFTGILYDDRLEFFRSGHNTNLERKRSEVKAKNLANGKLVANETRRF